MTRARSSGHDVTLGAQNQWITTLPAESFGAGTSYSHSSLGHDGVPVMPSASPTAGSVAEGAGGVGGALPGLVVGWAPATATREQRTTTALTSRCMAWNIARGKPAMGS